MEYRLEADITPTGIQELDRIAEAIDRLGEALNFNQQRRADLGFAMPIGWRRLAA